MVVSVLVEITLKKNEKTFDYIVPSNLKDKIKIGERVLVPFGNRKLEGFILDIKDKSDYDLKEIISVIDDEPILNAELLKLGEELHHENICNLISIYQAMLPKAYKASVKSKVPKKTISYLIINSDVNEFLRISKSNKQKELINDLLNMKEVLKSNYDSYVVRELIKKGLIKEIKKEVYRINQNNSKEPLNKLNNHQVDALNKINNSNKDTILLYGVTGSGKTEIYMHLINEELKKGKTAIMLVPEISLTPQIISRFKKHFSSDIAILHSGLSNGEKYDEYRKIIRGEVSIVIGARSAIFAPLKDIGIIIIDEEQSSTYKQDHNPKYDALKVAEKRIKFHNAKLILGSATPKIEDYAKAEKRYYELVSLTKRANNASLPKVEIIDMKNEIKRGNKIFSNCLLKEIETRLTKKEQIMLLINRRGYSNYLMCSNCGETIKCPNCDITLTYHKTSNVNRCHYCDYFTYNNNLCPKCNKESLKSFGFGSEKVEEEIKKIFPNASTIRMDMDTTSSKGSHYKIINSFYNHEYDILIGTQMIAKGLDFPLVSLVGIINADTLLNLPDFRNHEKTYELISQASGRAGRANIEGKVIIQTYNPDNYSINYAKIHDYVGFYNTEVHIRKKLKYPPYYFITTIKIGGKDFNETLSESKKIASFIKTKKEDNMIILGPSIGSVSKINNIYYFSIVIKHRNKEKVINLLNELVMLCKNNNKINLDIDI